MKQHTLSRLKTWSYLIASLVLMFLFILLDFQTIGKNVQSLGLSGLKWLILLNFIGFIAAVVLLNIWSIVQIHQYLRHHTAVIEAEKDRPCDYCGDAPAGPLICNHCNSILWGRINETLTDIAVFIAQHRWKLLTGLFALFLVGPLNFLYTKIKDRETERDKLIERSQEFIRQQNEFRSALADYELNNYVHTIDREKLSALYAKHMNITWELPRLIEDLAEMLNDPTGLESSNRPAKGARSFEQARFINYIIVQGGDTIDGKPIIGKPVMRWTRYLQTIYETARVSTSQSIDARKELAYNLDIEMRVVNAMVREFINRLTGAKQQPDVNANVFEEAYGSNLQYLDTINVSSYVHRKLWPRDSSIIDYPVMIHLDHPI